MTTQIQRRRGTDTQHGSFTGAEGELSVNTTNKSVHVHDGATAGGFEAARADLDNVSDADLNSALTGNTLSSLTITSADINGGTIDGTVIGGTTPAAGSFTTGSFTGDVTAEGLTVDGSGGKLSIEGTSIDDFVTTTEPSLYRTGSGGTGIFGSSGSLVIQPRTSAARNVSIATSPDGVSTRRRASFVGNGDINFYDEAGTTAKFVWDSSAESLGIGAWPASPLHVNGGGINNVATFESNDATASVRFIDSTQTQGVFVGAKGDDFYVQAGGGEKFRIDSGGHAIIPAGVTLGTSTGVYNADNTLDDYEEGTWDPQPADSSGNDATYAERSGNYTKIGNVVTATFFISNINTSGLTAADDFRINGLPFASKSIPNSSMYSGSARLDFITFSGTSNMLISDNTDYIRIGESISGAAHDFVRVTEVASGTADVRGSITYLAA